MLHATLIRAALWTTQLPGYWYEASPNAYGGNVFIVGNGGLSAVDETSGNILWTTTSAGSTDWDSPAISSEGAYAQSGNCLAGAYNPSSGASIWQVQSQCSGTCSLHSLPRPAIKRVRSPQHSHVALEFRHPPRRMPGSFRRPARS